MLPLIGCVFVDNEAIGHRVVVAERIAVHHVGGLEHACFRRQRKLDALRMSDARRRDVKLAVREAGLVEEDADALKRLPSE